MRQLSILIFVLACTMTWAQSPCSSGPGFRVLHFTKTNGFNHNTRSQSAAMFSAIGQDSNFTVTNTQETDLFDELDSLRQFAVIIWSNTSGNNVLSAMQESAMQTYIEEGGSFIGIHAATDTYRDRSWPFYNDLVGGIVQSGPNHTSNNYAGTMDQIGTHPVLANLPDPWAKSEEYYYWNEEKGGWLSPDIQEVLRVDTTGTAIYDTARPITWIQEFSGGGRSFYTALGHGRFNYTEPENDFRQLLSNAVCWAAETDAVLPINLHFFSLEEVDDGNRIRISLKADDIYEVAIERSSDGEQFLPIQEIALDDHFLEYSLIDYPDGASDIYYYRLRWTELDGSIGYSAIQITSRQTPQITLLNNAVANQLTIEVASEFLNEPYFIADAFGRILQHGRFAELQTSLSIGGWPSGSYFVKVPKTRMEPFRFVKG